MKLFNTHKGILLKKEDAFYLIDTDWDQLINQDNLHQHLDKLSRKLPHFADYQQLLDKQLKPPIQNQEIWASGVTYFRSKVARQEEANEAGGGSFYEKVYDAERPELFFKSTAHRAVGPNEKVRIRKDSSWDVPEPELTLVINSQGKIIGYTVGNDMSSRSIEGENPLYLAQAKVYDVSAAIGPCVLVTQEPLSLDTQIHLQIVRQGGQVFQESIRLKNMKRKPEELVSYLYRECSFPYGCLLMTGTGIVPPSDFTLQSGDQVVIAIDGIGTLVNEVA
jgi:2-dehydro-3-deoxy-D-arabinonate dehydratase